MTQPAEGDAQPLAYLAPQAAEITWYPNGFQRLQGMQSGAHLPPDGVCAPTTTDTLPEFL